MQEHPTARPTTAPPDPHEDPATALRNSRLGLRLFAVYVILYGGFMLLNVFLPQTMAQSPLARINLAIWYGLGLIVAALVLALLYMRLCRRRARPNR
jgi:uncharacterized membrane protein (DUF485 family)